MYLSLLTPYRSDTSARPELQKSPLPNQLPTPARQRVLGMTEARAGRPDFGDLGGVSRGVGNSDMHEIERGTSRITLHHSDTPMLVSIRSNARKRTRLDSPQAEHPMTPTSLNVSRDGQSPKRSRVQSIVPSSRWASEPVRGNLTSGM